MTAPLFHTAPDALAGLAVGARVLLDGPEGRHAAAVRRLTVGEPALLADGSGRLAHCTATEVTKAEVTFVVDALTQHPVEQPRFVLVQALAKDGRDLQAIESATELGVDVVVPWQAQRSIVQWREERATKAHAKWEGTVRAAAKQSRRARVPQVAELTRRTELLARVAESALTLILHEDADTSLAGIELPATGDVVVIVGPEGGISPEEVADLQAAGGHCVGLGPNVLRASTAGPAALAVLASRSRW
ncbi:16S rRNA (uracil(1498)-N(3))-methyltransferase [Demetria terragena]|uniref:16S rRNA (uracil(1498)-N(3))-methyltransferase n=1 Tax=Demetria terragena TaxID=63959 RepID=UPI000360A30D|nr:16S rRNA (uracil(1498)-N(3))-methyltransferase [Demetria terragena]